MPFTQFLKTCQQRIETSLSSWLPEAVITPCKLHEAMRYVSLDGGKRIRPTLVYATGQALDIPVEKLDGPACAVELIHAYSLVHDDLPAMDNDALRRGKPTCHIQYDEPTAILVGDALQSLAFYVIAHDKSMVNDAAQRLKMVQILAQASGSRGMAGGQAIDLASVGKALGLVELENMHIHKTGALIRASVRLGAMSNPLIEPSQLENLDHYAKCIGLAFQIQDDILDVEGDTAALGKAQGADIARNKPTYPSLIGLKESKAMAQDLIEQALQSINSLGEPANPLRWIAEYIIRRQN